MMIETDESWSIFGNFFLWKMLEKVNKKEISRNVDKKFESLSKK